MDLTPLIRSWNVCIQHLLCTTYCSAQHPELLAFFRTFWHSMSDDSSHTELLHRKIASSVSLPAHELQFPPTSLPPATQLPPKSVLAPFLCVASTSTQRISAAAALLHEMFALCVLWVQISKWMCTVSSMIDCLATALPRTLGASTAAKHWSKCLVGRILANLVGRLVDINCWYKNN